MRDDIINAVFNEVIGPDPNPQYLDPETGEELLLRRVHGSPKQRYGAGMLYPQATTGTDLVDDGESEIPKEAERMDSNQSTKNVYQNSKIGSISEDTASDEAIGLANEFLPSALGITCRLKVSDESISILIKTAWYEKTNKQFTEKVVVDKEGTIVEKENPFTKGKVTREAWVRRPFSKVFDGIRIKDLTKKRGRVLTKSILPKNNQGLEDWLRLEIFNRTSLQDKDLGFCTLTFTLVNSTQATGNLENDDAAILYQNELSIKAERGGIFVPYQERIANNDTDEEQELRMLYRKKRSFAIGHGCAAKWVELGEVREIQSAILPVYEMPSVGPTGYVELSMLELSDLGDWEKACGSMDQLFSQYSKWIEETRNSIPKLEGHYQEPARKNMEKCQANLDRMREGIDLLVNESPDSDLVKCFRWMNRAMIWQQQRSKTGVRYWKNNGDRKAPSYSLEKLSNGNQKHGTLEDFHTQPKCGWWRPFQLAFVLMNIKAIWEPNSGDRSIVDLIWFPTGGGKTEAYLGLAAFSILSRRIRGKSFDPAIMERNSGVTILMRYTLRLLTTQQYERASSLICGLELIRRKNLQLGPDPISIGLWVGGASTPNKRGEAISAFNELTGRNFKSAEYNFIVMKCPCCAAEIGKLQDYSWDRKVAGLKRTDGAASRARVFFTCENEQCEFFDDELPLYVVDDEIYHNCPTLILGTVDKFAMVPWKSEASRLFGFRSEGNGGVASRIAPPELIIQDELHLISGPLGTMVGLYETMIQEMCIDFQKYTSPFYPGENEYGVGPKIIASSATISRAKDQVKALYGTEKVNIFPPQGLEFGNTWFSEEKVPSKENQGRKYLGILAPGYRSGQTTVVRTYVSILQAAKLAAADDKLKNYYWTLVGYFNSIRELGMANSLIHADIKDYFKSLQNRKLIPIRDRRYPELKFRELTSRISAAEIPDALKVLEKDFSGRGGGALDLCMATNMIATGVDVSRLGLMIIHGQPKTAAEYIQASSRVGRDPRGPGLVLMLYGPSKPRDRSQYEHFQNFHSRIYSHVEPTSITPFSINARERALHAVLIGLVRHFAADTLRVNPSIPSGSNEFNELCSWVKNVITKRCKTIDPAELTNTLDLLDKKIRFWNTGFSHYGDAGNFGIRNNGITPLMYSKSAEVAEKIVADNRSLPTPTSMRGVDDEGRVAIMPPYQI